jgi:hypothetical protein
MFLGVLIKRMILVLCIFAAVPFIQEVMYNVSFYLNQDRLIFPLSHAPEPLDELPFENTVILEKMNRDGLVQAWLVPAAAASADQPAPAVLYFHGNAEIIDHQHRIVNRYNDLGISVLLVEYRGYGRSTGKPSQAGILDDALAFHQRLGQRDDVDADRIFYHGRSLGGGVAAALADKQSPKALVLESTFASMALLTDHYSVPSFLLKHPFRSDRVLRRAEFPVLVFHGVSDVITPVGEARTLNKIAQKHGRVLDYVEMPGGHNAFPPASHEALYWSHVAKFLTDKGVLRRGVGA